MKKFMVITKSPQTRTMMGVIGPKYTVDETEAETLEEILGHTRVPEHGEVHIIEMCDVTTIKSELITRILLKEGDLSVSWADAMAEDPPDTDYRQT